jgi:hypothetical protein
MQIAIISTALAIVLFLTLYFGFREGLRLGMNVSKGKPIEPVKSPIKAIQEHIENKEVKKAEKELQDEIDAIMGYTGDLPEDGE